MAGNVKPSVYRIYLLTVWHAQDHRETANASWRFHLTDPQTGKRYGFTDPTTLLAALQNLMGEAPPTDQVL